MPFFLPSRLIDFEYLGGDIDEEQSKLARDYQYEIDFAFFAVHFYYSKSDYDALTLREKAFIMKAYEDKVVGESVLLNKAVNVAVVNALRKKNKKPVKLWKKKTQKANKEDMQEKVNIVLEMEKTSGKDWVKLIKGGG